MRNNYQLLYQYTIKNWRREWPGNEASQLAISIVTSLVPRLTILIFGMGTRLLVRMRTKLLIDQDEVEAMKTPIGCRALRCDKD